MNSAKPSKVLVHPRTGKQINAWAAAHGGGYQHSAAGLITNVFWHKSRKETNDPPHTRSHAMPLASFQKEARGVAPPPNRGVYFLERQYLSKLRPSHHAPNNDAILNVQRWLFKHICKHIRLHGRKPSLNIFPSSLSTERKYRLNALNRLTAAIQQNQLNPPFHSGRYAPRMAWTNHVHDLEDIKCLTKKNVDLKQNSALVGGCP